MQKARRQAAMTEQPNVSFPMFHTFGFDDCRTLSVVTDVPRMSPVSITNTISMGVRMGCPVTIKPMKRKSTPTIFFVTELRV